MRKYLLSIIFGIIFLYILSQPSLAIDTEKCRSCHGTVMPIPKESITKDCSACHGMHATEPQPIIREPTEVHSRHTIAGKYVSQSSCQICHQSPINCTKCHNSHDLESIKRAVLPKTVNNTQNISVKLPLCTDCHGNLPQPKGHENFRKALASSKHQWMKCDTCHLNPSMGTRYEFRLHFKDLFIVPIDNSINLCKICHSSQYEIMNENIHGTVNNTCIDCHNPHTTQLSGPKFVATPKATPVNVSVRVEESKKWLFEKVPILNNPTLMIIILILIFVFTAEYLLSRHEEGKKVAYNMVKFQASEETLKTLEVKLNSQDITVVNDILQKYGNILGMTMTREDDNIYKYVIFVNTSQPIDDDGEKDLIDKISLLDTIKSAQFTDKYEL